MTPIILCPAIERMGRRQTTTSRSVVFLAHLALPLFVEQSITCPACNLIYVVRSSSHCDRLCIRRV